MPRIVTNNDAISLRPYQREAVDAVHAAGERGVRRPAIGLPTGTGKTIVFAEAIRERGYPALILAHRDELIEQAVEKYQRVDPAAWVGVVKGKSNQTEGDVIVASVQTLARDERLAQLAREFKTLVIDEAHHAVAATYRKVAEHFSSCPLILGVSATLERADKVGMKHAWDEVVYFKTLQEMIAAGYLVDIRALQVRLGIDFKLLRVSRGDFTGASVEGALRETGASSVAVQAYLEHAAGRKTILFTPTVATAYEMAAAFEQAGVPATAIDHKTPTAERRAKLRAFATGDIQVMANAMILTEGFDEPSVECIIVARPTRNRPLYVQMVGRGTRLHPGKEDLLVIDLVGNTDRVDLVTLPKLFGLAPRDLPSGQGAVEFIRGLPERAMAAAGLRRVDFEVEGVDLFDRKGVNWLHLDDGRWLLNVGKVNLYLESDGDRWATRARWWDSERSGRQERTLGDGLDLGYAMGIAEERVRKAGKEALVDKTARWRKDPASAKQIEHLRRNQIPVSDDLTKGDAADLLSAVFAA